MKSTLCSQLVQSRRGGGLFFVFVCSIPKGAHIKNCINLGIAWKGGGGSGLAQIAWSTFFHQLKDLGTSHKGGGGVIGLYCPPTVTWGRGVGTRGPSRWLKATSLRVLYSGILLSYIIVSDLN